MNGQRVCNMQYHSRPAGLRVVASEMINVHFFCLSLFTQLGDSKYQLVLHASDKTNHWTSTKFKPFRE